MSTSSRTRRKHCYGCRNPGYGPVCHPTCISTKPWNHGAMWHQCPAVRRAQFAGEFPALAVGDADLGSKNSRLGQLNAAVPSFLCNLSHSLPVIYERQRQGVGVGGDEPVTTVQKGPAHNACRAGLCMGLDSLEQLCCCSWRSRPKPSAFLRFPPCTRTQEDKPRRDAAPVPSHSPETSAHSAYASSRLRLLPAGATSCWL